MFTLTIRVVFDVVSVPCGALGPTFHRLLRTIPRESSRAGWEARGGSDRPHQATAIVVRPTIRVSRPVLGKRGYCLRAAS